MTEQRALIWAAVVVLLGCQSAAPEPPARTRPLPRVPVVASSAPGVPSAPPPDFHQPAPERLVAIGDIHGDLQALRRALRLCGAIDDTDRWTGGKLVVVQTGDAIDRGDDDRAVLEIEDRLADSAEAAGGRFVALNGNHEAMNVNSDLRYVTAAGLSSFEDLGTGTVSPGLLQQFKKEQHARIAAFAPGGPFALRLSQRDAVVMIGSTVFAHGGVRAEHVAAGIGKLNQEIRRWMSGHGSMPALARDPDGPLWTRRYSDEAQPPDCGGLDLALKALSAKRMVVGHTPQRRGITNACDGKVWRIDTGLSRYYGGPTEVLEIRGETVVVLRAPS